MRSIGIGNVVPELLYMAVMPLCTEFNNLIKPLFPEKETRLFLNMVFDGLGNLLFGLIGFILFKNIRKRKAEIIKSESVPERKDKIPLTQAQLYIRLGLLGFFNQIIFFVYSWNKNNFPTYLSEFTQIFQIVILLYLCKFRLHSLYYRHHVISLVVYEIALLLLFISFFDISQSINIGDVFIDAIGNILIIEVEIEEKKLMETEEITPSEILTIEGTFKMVTGLIIIILAMNIRCFSFFMSYFSCSTEQQMMQPSENVYKIFLQPSLLLLYFLYSIQRGSVTLIRKLISFYFTPVHRLLADSLSHFVFLQINFYSSSRNFIRIILFVLSTLFNIFSQLIFFEVLVLYKCGLSVNTKVGIEARILEENSIYYRTIQEKDKAKSEKLFPLLNQIEMEK